MKIKLLCLNIVSLTILFFSCTEQKRSTDDIASVFKDARLQIERIHNNGEYPYGTKIDSIMQAVLCREGSFDYSLDSMLTVPYYSSVSEDRRVRLITLCGIGSMETGISYIQYRKNDSTLVCRKIADVEESDKGGCIFPACYKEIHCVKGNEYVVCGTFRFSANAESVNDTLLISSIDL